MHPMLRAQAEILLRPGQIIPLDAPSVMELVTLAQQLLEECKRVEANENRAYTEAAHDRDVWHQAYRDEHAICLKLHRELEHMRRSHEITDRQVDKLHEVIVAARAELSRECPMCGEPGAYGHVCPEHSD